MQKQTIEFGVVSHNGVIQQIGRSSILTPKTNYSGKGIKWYEDKPKKARE